MKSTNYLKALVLVIILSTSLSVFAQDDKTDIGVLVTDRPDATESPNTVTKGYIQFETGGFFESFEEGTFRTETYVFNTTLVRYGLLDNLELRLGWDLLENQTTNNGNRFDVNGFNPLLLGLKIAIAEEKGWRPQIGFIGHLFLPFTANDDLRPETTGTNLLLAFAHTLSEKSSLSYNIGAEIMGGSPELAYVYSIAYGYSFTDKFGGYIELYGDLPEDSSSNHLWDAGLTYLLSDNVQLDATVGTSITDGQDILLSAGVSFRLPTKKQ